VLSVRIRTATAGDLAAIQRVFREASLSNSGDRASLLQQPDSLVFPPGALVTGRVRLAVSADGAVLGFATTTRADDGLELDDLFVEPGSMRRGVGRRLVEDVVEFARAEGAVRVLVTANPHAMAFYESVGFVPDGTTHTRFGPASRMRLDVDPGVTRDPMLEP
jgi:GNAT superfamily N-acetyltransferase